MTTYYPIYYQSGDGLTLFAREYPSDSDRPTLLCMPGLTRNSADFEPLVAHFYPDHQVVAVDLRGRGLSQWDPQPANYHPGTYVEDMFALLDRLALDRPVLVGTSLGGLMAMMMNAMAPGAFAGMVINDVGPVVEPAGLARIQQYVGRDPAVSSWAEAVASTRAIGELAYPHFGDDDWEQLTRRIYREDTAGVPVLMYDPAIAQPMADSGDNAVPPDLWQVFDAAPATPALVIRGALSDILGAGTVAEMQKRKPGLQAVEVPGVGHAPILDEPPAVAALRSFLASIV